MHDYLKARPVKALVDMNIQLGSSGFISYRVLERVEQKFHLEGVTKYNNFLQKVGFSIFFIRIKSATPVNFWHKIGELWRPNMKDTATLMTYRERNWLQFMRNYSLVMS